MLCVGIYAALYKTYENPNINDLNIDPIVGTILVIGSVVFVITFFGCVGALRENLCMLRIFALALVLVLLFELVLVFAVFIVSENGSLSHIQRLMHKSIAHYRDDPDLQNIIDWGQEEFHCCGVINRTDWSGNIYFHCDDENRSMERCGVPYSCCLPPDDGVVNTFCGMDVQVMDDVEAMNVVYMEGCLFAFTDWVNSCIFYLCWIFLLLGCIPQVLGILFARILVIQIKDQEFYTQIGLLNPRGEFEWFV